MTDLHTAPPHELMAATAQPERTGPDRGAEDTARSAATAPLLKLVRAARTVQCGPSPFPRPDLGHQGRLE